MRRFFRNRWIKIPFRIFVFAFALIGLFLTGSYAAIKLKLTNDPGSVDVNNRYFHGEKEKYNQSFLSDTTSLAFQKYETLERILLLNRFHPKNAQFILNAYRKCNNEREVMRMLDAVDIQLKNDKLYQIERKKLFTSLKGSVDYRDTSAFEWMNLIEWTDLKIAIAKDKHLIDSVANLTGVEARLIVCCLIGEQIRLFNSNREAYKQWIGPLKILTVETTFSYGVTGIKEHTAQTIEGYLKDPSSEFYLGKQFEHLLNFKSDSVQQERMARLCSIRNHFYSYMYAALFMKQVKTQWEKAGYPIENRPEILGTLFNVGFPQSEPKSNPRVGGSRVLVRDKYYTFGAIAYQFYYSGELFDLFPIRDKKFDWKKNEV